VLSEGVQAEEGRTIEEARASFDNSLSVSLWKVSPDAPDRTDDRDPLAPAWWTSDEDASQSFLREQGIIL
jgi:hypothetical protein